MIWRNQNKTTVQSTSLAGEQVWWEKPMRWEGPRDTKCCQSHTPVQGKVTKGMSFPELFSVCQPPRVTGARGTQRQTWGRMGPSSGLSKVCLKDQDHTLRKGLAPEVFYVCSLFLWVCFQLSNSTLWCEFILKSVWSKSSNESVRHKVLCFPPSSTFR